jgi:PHD/YefM family antitoxin component YafN of YafNO toxin-antitoxin module
MKTRRAREGDGFMPTIKSSTDLRNRYNEISTFCHANREPVFITKNGCGDLAVMSIDEFNGMRARLELYALIAESKTAIAEGRATPLKDAMRKVREDYAGGVI